MMNFGLPGFWRALFHAWARRALNFTEETVLQNLLVLNQRGLVRLLRSAFIKLIEFVADCRNPIKVFCV